MLITTKRFLSILAPFLLSSSGLCFVQAQPTYDYRLVDSRCDPDQCLFVQRAAEIGGYLDSVIGTVRVTGYYGSIVREDSSAETIAPRRALTCPGLVMTSAPKFFQRAFKNLVEVGNTVNRMDREGRLVLALNFGSLKVAEVKRIKRTGRQHLVRLTLFKPVGLEGELTGCGSLFKVLRVEGAKK